VITPLAMRAAFFAASFALTALAAVTMARDARA
jgi:hypothetical protein